MPITPGLVSISFRALAPAAVIAAAKAAGLTGIEWGGDVHAPHGDVAAARNVAALTTAADLRVAAYGSYYRLGVSEAAGLSFAAVVASAQALGAPVIRVWVGDQGSAETAPAKRAAIIADAKRCADLAAAAGIRVLSEWHGGTLTDNLASGRDFLTAVGHPAFATVWQPSVGLTTDDAHAELVGVLPWVEHLHVFHWDVRERRALADGADRWRRYFATALTTGRNLTAALEFVIGDDPAQLVRDGATLNHLLQELP